MSISMLSYGIHKFRLGDIDTFIDIGAERGSVSSFVRKALSPSRIITLEPCKENFEALLKTNEKMGDFMECHNIAYGCGGDLWYLHTNSSYSRRFLTISEWAVWKDGAGPFGDVTTYPIESKTLEQIFHDYNIDYCKPYIIKMDCEGCERLLLDNQNDIYYISHAALFTAEFHFFGHDFDGTPRDESSKYKEFSSWIWDNFSSTHDICIGKKKDYNLQYNVLGLEDYLGRQKLTRHIRLIRKEWAKRFKS